MDSLRELQSLIAQVESSRDESEDTAESHRKIYAYVCDTILSPKSPLVKNVPPLDVIIYSIKRILYPTFNTLQIPDVLDLIATAEFYRERTLSEARNALVWHSYYSGNDMSPVNLLTSEEESFLKKLETSNEVFREIYITIVCNCCHLDLYNLWTAHPPSMTNFFIHFNEYFPFLNENCAGTQSPRLFHHNLSEEELNRFRETRRAFCEFVRDSSAWAEQHRDSNQSLQSMFRTEGFLIRFPRPRGTNDLLSLIEFYLGNVERAAQQFQSVFPPDNQ